jgi:hypothetical protein
VRSLVADLVADGVGATVSESVRETVKGVAELLEDGHESVTVAAVAGQLGIDKSSASRRIKAALARDYLSNLEIGKGKPLKLVIGEPLPEEVEVLPRAETLAGCTVAAVRADDVPPPLTIEPDEIGRCPRCGGDALWSHAKGGGWRCAHCEPPTDEAEVALLVTGADGA